MASQLGFHFVDIKHCHGYLGARISQRAHAKREVTAETFENRTRFLRDVVEGIQSPSRPGS